MDISKPERASRESSGGQIFVLFPELEAFLVLVQDLMRNLEAWSMELARHCPEEISSETELSTSSVCLGGLESMLWDFGAVPLWDRKGIHQRSVSCAPPSHNILEQKLKHRINLSL